METRLYMTAKTEGNTPIVGSGTGDHEGQIPLCGFDHQVSIRADGARGHGKLIVHKALDGCSPRLTQALCKGEVLPTVQIDWYEAGLDGTEKLFFRHTLESATIVLIRQRLVEEAQSGASVEELDLRCRKITWGHMPTNHEANDIWVEGSADQ